MIIRNAKLTKKFSQHYSSDKVKALGKPLGQNEIETVIWLQENSRNELLNESWYHRMIR